MVVSAAEVALTFSQVEAYLGKHVQDAQVAAAAPIPVAPRTVTIYRGSEKSDATSGVVPAGDSTPPLPSLPAPR